MSLSFSLALLGSAAADTARLGCGDDVDGVRVPCRCGDVVVADTVLRSDDPVVSERCPTDGLLVRAGAGAASIRLDLAGHTLAGTGQGVGIRVVDGGAQGAVVVGGTEAKGIVVGFATGLRAAGRRSLAEVRSLRLVANRYDGLIVYSDGVDIVDVSAEDNGRDGVRASGRDALLADVVGRGNARSAVRTTGVGARLEGATRLHVGEPSDETESRRRRARKR